MLATDIFDKKLKALRNSRWDKAFHSEHSEKFADESDTETSTPVLRLDDVNRKATIVIEHIIQVRQLQSV